MKRLVALALAAASAAAAQTPPAPPIPHDIKGYYVLRQENNCLECHDNPGDIGKKRTKGLPPAAPASHYDKVEPKAPVAEGHFFCTTCHLPSR